MTKDLHSSLEEVIANLKRARRIERQVTVGCVIAGLALAAILIVIIMSQLGR